MNTCEKHNEEKVTVGASKRLKCRSCNKEYQAKWWQDNKEVHKQRVRENNLKLISRNQDFIYSYLLSHACLDCGESDPIVLDFDHLRDKYKGVSRLVYNGSGLDQIIQEIDKCEVVCANCHRRRTAQRSKSYRFLQAPVAKW